MGRIRRRAAANTKAFSTTISGTPRSYSWAARSLSGRRTVPVVPGVERYAPRTRWTYSSCVRGCSSTCSPLQVAQRRAVDAHRVTEVPQSAQQRFHHRPVAQEVRPLFILQIGRNNRGMVAVAFLHQFEKDVGLLRLEIQIPKFVYRQDIQARQALEQLSRGPVRQRRIHFIEEVLGFDELAAVAVLQRLQQQTASQPSFPSSGFAHEHDIFGLGNKLQLRESAYLFAVHPALPGEGKGFQRQSLWQLGSPNAPFPGAQIG